MTTLHRKFPESIKFNVPPGLTTNPDEGINDERIWFQLEAGDGGDGQEDNAGGNGAFCEGYISCSTNDEIEIILGESGTDGGDQDVPGFGGDGYVKGEDGEGHEDGETDAGGGGGSSAILLNGELIVHSGGGGGGGGDASTLTSGDDGGDGGGPGGEGGSGGMTLGASGDPGEDGEVEFNTDFVELEIDSTDVGNGNFTLEFWAEPFIESHRPIAFGRDSVISTTSFMDGSRPIGVSRSSFIETLVLPDVYSRNIGVDRTVDGKSLVYIDSNRPISVNRDPSLQNSFVEIESSRPIGVRREGEIYTSCNVLSYRTLGVNRYSHINTNVLTEWNRNIGYNETSSPSSRIGLVSKRPIGTNRSGTVIPEFVMLEVPTMINRMNIEI